MGFRHRYLDRDLVPVGVGILLDDDRVRPGGNGTAGEDPHALSGGERFVMFAAGRCMADHVERHRRVGDVLETNRVAVHGGDGDRRLRAARPDIACQHPAKALGQTDLFGLQGREGGQYPGACFVDREHYTKERR